MSAVRTLGVPEAFERFQFRRRVSRRRQSNRRGSGIQYRLEGWNNHDGGRRFDTPTLIQSTVEFLSRLINICRAIVTPVMIFAFKFSPRRWYVPCETFHRYQYLSLSLSLLLCLSFINFCMKKHFVVPCWSDKNSLDIRLIENSETRGRKTDWRAPVRTVKPGSFARGSSIRKFEQTSVYRRACAFCVGSRWLDVRQREI